jgi:phosphoribosyl 1,2-cyclic phosphate phosphodiesterase
MVPPSWRYENEDSFQEDLETIKKLGAMKTVFMHIEEAWGKSYDDYKRLEADLTSLNIEFAYDGMRINI